MDQDRDRDDPKQGEPPISYDVWRKPYNAYPKPWAIMIIVLIVFVVFVAVPLIL
jgi:hypothetical protein